MLTFLSYVLVYIIGVVCTLSVCGLGRASRESDVHSAWCVAKDALNNGKGYKKALTIVEEYLYRG